MKKLELTEYSEAEFYRDNLEEWLDTLQKGINPVDGSPICTKWTDKFSWYPKY